MTLVLRYSARSDRGLVRQNNQDAVYAGPRLLALADGMGGHAAGEVASSLVISALAPLDDDAPSDDLLAELRHATVEGNAAITRHIADAPDLEGMGTTLTAILFAGSRLGLVHVGDSRAYQLRDGVLTQITKDDTFVQSLIDEGRITEEEAHTHPQRSLLLRAITGQDVDPSLTIREARPGDRYLLCSDGLSGVVSDETLAETLRAYRDPRECADRMIDLALRGGGPDNITCIVADVVDIDFGEDAPIVGGSVGDGNEDAAAGLGRRPGLGDHAHPDRAQPGDDAPRRPPVRTKSRLGLKLAVALLAALAVLVGGGALARVWVMQQYFVGFDAEQVVIFQGVRGDVLGLPLHRVAERTDIAATDLPETERSQVSDGIYASDGLDDARRLVDRLRALMLLRARPPRRPRSWRPRPSRTRPWRRPALRSTRPYHPRWTPRPCRRCRPSRERPAGRWADGHRRRGQHRPPRRPLPTGRGIELVLLAFAALLVTGALVLVEANQEQELRPALFYVGVAYLALFTAAHFAVRRFAPYADPLILPCVALLNGLGLVMIHRLDLAKIDQATALGRELPTELVYRQIAWTAIGLVLFVAVLGLVRDHRTAGPLRLHRRLRRAGPAGPARRAAGVDLRGQRGPAVAAAGHLLDPAR